MADMKLIVKSRQFWLSHQSPHPNDMTTDIRHKCVMHRYISLRCSDMCHTAVASLANLHPTMPGMLMMVTALMMLRTLYAAIMLDIKTTPYQGKITCQNHHDNMSKPFNHIAYRSIIKQLRQQIQSFRASPL